MPDVLLVAGETLIDLVVHTDGSLSASPGGAPSNTAVAAARLGLDVRFAGGVSTDRFGRQLLGRLVDAGVDVESVQRTDAPTSLAVAELGRDGAATYRFYFDGTAAPALARVDQAGASIVFAGGLGLVLEPMATTIERAVGATTVPVVIDVNCRPAVVADIDEFVRRVDRVVARASVVKVSDEDLAVLRPGVAVDAAVSDLLEVGARSVVVTAGSAPTIVATHVDRLEVPVPPLADELVDTIGAGDTFVAGLLAGLVESSAVDVTPATPAADLVDAVRLGQRAAAVVVTRRGADPPTRADLALR
ncbi:MAG: PfkB family carbohydrate kinase [Actinomycetota bacterium]